MPPPPASSTEAPTPHPPSPSAAMIAQAFGLGRPIESLVPHHHGNHETWALATMAGRFLVKRLWVGPDPEWRPDLDRAMAFEVRACDAGIDAPRPIEPRSPAFGCATRVHGFGVFRAYEWIDHRPVDKDDDLGEWLGATLARLHQLEPLDATPEPQSYGLFPAVRWHAWLADGEAQGRLWAPALRKHLADILDASRWIGEAFAEAGGYVVTHRAVEPWNVLISERGPVLIDWDTSGPDSAPLEAAHALLDFAAFGRSAPDAAMVRRALSAYTAEGGAAPGTGRAVIARRVGLRLTRLAERLEVTLGLVDHRSIEPMQADVRAREQIEELPDLVMRLTGWSTLLAT
ncbi:aminoglycoside phosphotransferase family protein [Actinopolymorpha sp. B9G3]|uniref:aminoglycoside phosphotransferase family protein n=1 Tax=Actinopolymorpha sp. B9G3 TaxID=3158970 RepID=UPI0032D9576C